jgi:hypothetical protein
VATRGEPPNHAEVDEGDTVAGQVEYVAWMWVGVEETVFHNHLQYRSRPASGKHLAVEACLMRPGIPSMNSCTHTRSPLHSQ